MIRLTKKVFNDLALWMIFPFFVIAMGVSISFALSPLFFSACMAAGVILGALNIGLARSVVGGRLRKLGERMHHVELNLREMTTGRDMSRCTPEECSITIDS